MNRSVPEVSVVVPFHRQANQLRQSCLSLQHQTFTAWEALLVDDLAPPECAAMALAFCSNDPRFRLLRLRDPHSPGPWLARNRAVAAARGRWIAFLDADDLWHPQKLARQVALHRGGSELSACTYDRFRLTPAGPVVVERRRPPRQLSFGRLLRGNVIPLSAAMVERSLLEQLSGPFRPEHHEDYGLWLRLLAHRPQLRWACLPEPLMAYRIHNNSISNRRWQSVIAVQRLLRSYVPSWALPWALLSWGIERTATALAASASMKRHGLPAPITALLTGDGAEGNT